MPIYEYRCQDCEHEFERMQKFSDPPVDTCPTCSGSVKKLISRSAFHLKGDGWYVTDYARKGSSENGKSSTDGSSSASSTSSSDSSTSGSDSSTSSSDSSGSSSASSSKSDSSSKGSAADKSSSTTSTADSTSA